MSVKTGRLEVAEAVAAVSGLVTVTLVGTSFTVEPDNLFELTFNDPLVGIDDDRMPDFKESLKELLANEGIDETINQIAENSSIVIEDVAEIIRLALALKGAQTRLSNVPTPSPAPESGDSKKKRKRKKK